jgi:uncharacterized protein (DUF433 family)
MIVLPSDLSKFIIGNWSRSKERGAFEPSCLGGIKMTMAKVEQLLARLGSGIESTEDFCGGDPRIAETRIPVWTLEHDRRLGLTEAQILAAFPALRATDLVNAWSLVADHGDEIDRQIRENEEAWRLAQPFRGR